MLVHAFVGAHCYLRIYIRRHIMGILEIKILGLSREFLDPEKKFLNRLHSMP